MVLDLHDHAVIAVDVEAECAADARAVEQRMDHDRVALAGRRRDPVGDEVGEFLGRAAGDVERQAARRHADLSQLAHRPEVGRAQERGPGLALRPVALQATLLNPESCERVGVGWQLARWAVLRHGEVIGRVDDLPRLAVLDRVHPHRLGEKAADKLERDRIGARAVTEQRVLGTKAQLAMCVIVDPTHHVGRRLRRRYVRSGGLRLRALDEQLEAERLGGTESQTGLGRLCLGPQLEQGQRADRRGGEQRFAPLQLRHRRHVLRGGFMERLSSQLGNSADCGPCPLISVAAPCLSTWDTGLGGSGPR